VLDTREPLLVARKEDTMNNDAPGMRGIRSRTKHGPLREKRGDTHISTIENRYGIDLGVRSDMHLDEYLKKRRIDSLNDLITGR